MNQGLVGVVLTALVALPVKADTVVTCEFYAGVEQPPVVLQYDIDTNGGMVSGVFPDPTDVNVVSLGGVIHVFALTD